MKHGRCFALLSVAALSILGCARDGMVDEPVSAGVEAVIEPADLSADVDVQVLYSLGLRPGMTYYLRVSIIENQARYRLVTWRAVSDRPMAEPIFPLADANVRTGRAELRAVKKLEQALDGASAWDLPDANKLRADDFKAAESALYLMRLWNAKRMERPHSLQVITGTREALRDSRYRAVLMAVEQVALGIDPQMDRYMPPFAHESSSHATTVRPRAWATIMLCYLASFMLLTVGVRQVGRAIAAAGRPARIAVAGVQIAAGMAFLYAASVILSNALWR